MMRGPEGQELPISDEGRETIELSADDARDAMNGRMRAVFGDDGDKIDPEEQYRVIE